jgi:hypothetical protein
MDRFNNFQLNADKLADDERCDYCENRDDPTFVGCDECRFQQCKQTSNSEFFVITHPLTPGSWWELLNHKCFKCWRAEHEFRGDQLYIKIPNSGLCIYMSEPESSVPEPPERGVLMERILCNLNKLS